MEDDLVNNKIRILLREYQSKLFKFIHTFAARISSILFVANSPRRRSSRLIASALNSPLSFSLRASARHFSFSSSLTSSYIISTLLSFSKIILTCQILESFFWCSQRSSSYRILNLKLNKLMQSWRFNNAYLA